MKRILGLILTLVLLCSLSFAAVAEETAEIEFFLCKTEVQGVMQEIIDDFQAANPGIKVTLTYTADSETVLATRLAANDVPDVIQLYPAEKVYREMLDNGYIVDMTDAPFQANVAQTMLDLAAYEGKQISLPYTLSLYGIHYNVDIFNEVGIEVPTNMEELIAACAKLKEAGYDAFALPMNGPAQLCERTISAFDGSNYKELEACAAGELAVEEIKAVKALGEFLLAIKPYSTEDAMGMNGDAAHNDFMNGKAAMKLDGSWYLSTVKGANPDFNVGLFGIPSPVYNDTIIPVNIDAGFAVSATTEYPEAAMKFVEWLSTTEAAAKYYQVDGNINMINGVEYDKVEYMDVYNKIMDGKMSLTQVNFWMGGTNMRSAIAAAAQELYSTEDWDAYYQAIEDAIIELSDY